MKLPSNYKLLYDKSEIQNALSKIALQLDRLAEEELARSKSQLLIIAPMRGALFFAADLLRQIKYSVEIRTITVSTYAANQKSSEANFSQAFAGLATSLKNRLVVVIDEICDSGQTLDLLSNIASQQAYQVKSAALLVRERFDRSFKPDYFGLSYSGDEWLVGYGMDDNEHFRNLAQIYKVDAKKC